MTYADNNRWVNIIFPHPPYQTFTYTVPEKFRKQIKKGQRVLVPLGKRQVYGLIESFSEKPALKNMREIINITDTEPILTTDVFELTKWIASYYLTPWGMVVKTALPPGTFNKNKVKIQYEQSIHLTRTIHAEEIAELKKKAPVQARVLKILLENKEGVKRKKIKERIDVLNRLQQKGLINFTESEVIRDPYKNTPIIPPKSIKITKEQNSALMTIKDATDKNQFNPILLHGITSSGKTQVYIEAIKHIFERGNTALVLIPEISLTPQAVQRYKSHFGDQVAVLHSRMSTGERYDTWRKIKDGTFKITIGPRSALFAPLDNLGIIIVDEEHDASYKQKNPAPRYHARDSAIVRAKINNCVIILGSATPSLESYHNAIKGKYSLCTLSQRIDDLPLPKVTLIDHKKTIIKKETRVFCPVLKENILLRLENGDQIILLQNRRGYSTFLRCSSCGNIESCPNCDISLTYHQKNHLLMCHTCNFQKKAPDSCPACGGTIISYRGIGTQRVEEELIRLFPDSKITRMDQDTTRRKGTHDKIITDFENKNSDILFGTQMIAKGHDFPGVNLVGIISADTGLYFPDFRSGEKTFQLLTQAAGRAGRKGMPGEVIIQTMNPEHPVLQFAVDHDYEKFFKYESRQRRELQYPPWGRIIIVRFRSRINDDAAKAAQLFYQNITKNKSVITLGPAVCPISRIKNYYRYQIMFRSSKAKDPSGRILRDNVRETMKRYLGKRKFPNVKIAIDVDPVDVM